LPEYERTGCSTVVLEVPEEPLAKANRLALRLLCAAVAAEDYIITECHGASRREDILSLLADAIAEGERYCLEDSDKVAERIISKHLS
jgi:hypothetical protein